MQSITDELDNTGTRGMTYDALDRLSTVWAPGIWGSARYSYDALDNMTSSVVGPRNSNYQYNNRNLLETLTSNVASMNLGYRHDARGNANRRGNQVLTFDQGNRLAFISGLESYLYDGFGHRTRTTNVDGTVTLTLYSPAGQLLYTKRSGGPNPPAHTEYIYLHNHQIAEVAR